MSKIVRIVSAVSLVLLGACGKNSRELSVVGDSSGSTSQFSATSTPMRPYLAQIESVIPSDYQSEPVAFGVEDTEVYPFYVKGTSGQDLRMVLSKLPKEKVSLLYEIACDFDGQAQVIASQQKSIEDQIVLTIPASEQNWKEQGRTCKIQKSGSPTEGILQFRLVELSESPILNLEPILNVTHFHSLGFNENEFQFQSTSGALFHATHTLVVINKNPIAIEVSLPQTVSLGIHLTGDQFFYDERQGCENQSTNILNPVKPLNSSRRWSQSIDLSGAFERIGYLSAGNLDHLKYRSGQNSLSDSKIKLKPREMRRLLVLQKSLNHSSNLLQGANFRLDQRNTIQAIDHCENLMWSQAEIESQCEYLRNSENYSLCIRVGAMKVKEVQTLRGNFKVGMLYQVPTSAGRIDGVGVRYFEEEGRLIGKEKYQASFQVKWKTP